MSFLSALVQTYGRRPLWLAEITREASAWRFNLAPRAYVAGGQTYAASSLSFDELTYSQEARKDDLTLDGFPVSDPATQALIAPADAPTWLTLRRGFEGDPEILVALRARLTSIKPGRRSVSLVFSSWADDAGKRLDGFVAQRQCPWLIYSPECGLNRGAHQIDATVTAYQNQVATVSDGPGAKFAGGLLRLGGVARTIVKVNGGNLTLSAPFPALEAAAKPVAVKLAPGCDKSRQRCAQLDNIKRFGGFPVMSDNPFTTRVL